MARGTAVPGRITATGVIESLARELVPAVIGVLVRRGADFASAEDAVQEALIRAIDTWDDDPPRDAKAWLISVAWRSFLDTARSETSRRARETAVEQWPPPGTVSSRDDTLRMYFLCAHPALNPNAAAALTLRALGGLTTRQIAAAYLVPEATMAQRITRATRRVAGLACDQAGDGSTVRRVLYLIFKAGYTGEVDLAVEAIRLTRQLAGGSDDPEVNGLLALMLLHDARRGARTGASGRLIPLREQDRSLWDTKQIAEAVGILQTALSRDRLGEYQAQAAIAALHADAPSTEETDWLQIVEWYDELLAVTASPVVQLNRAVALGEAYGAQAGLSALADVDSSLPRYTAALAYLSERAGDLSRAADLYVQASQAADNVPERDHLIREAARVHGTCDNH